jgi:peptidoglycan-associated lipoprotein
MGRVKTGLLVVLAGLLASCSATRFGKIAADSRDIGEYYKAIENYRKAYRKEKKDRDLRTEYAYQLAECYRYIGEYDRAALYYRNAIRRNYPLMESYLWYAEMLRATQEYEDAQESFRMYLDSVPDSEIALKGLEAIEKTRYWQENPTRHIVTRIKELNSSESDYCPVFVAGRDNEIIFTSTRKASTGKKKSMITGQKYADLYRSRFEIQRQKWDKPNLIDQNLVINTGDEEGASSLTANGSKMFFTRCRYDKTQDLGSEIYSSSQSKGSWSNPVKVNVLGDSMVVAHPALSEDESVLYFVSDMPGGMGGKDIWMADQGGENFSNPRNLGPEINTPGDEMFPYVRGNDELYFSSNYHLGMGGFDIFKAVREEGGSWTVENMGSPINSPGDDFGIAFVQGENKGMLSSNRKGSRGDDLYSFLLPPKVFEVTGQVFDKETGNPINNASVRIIGTDGTNLKIRAQGGKFHQNLSSETEYVFAAFEEGYLNDKARESTIGLEDSKEFVVDLYLTPTDAPIRIQNIHYEFNSAELLPESIVALDTLIEILEVNPTIVIELMSHTDHIGSDAFNFELSQRRAQSVVDYLISKGIHPERLVAKGYGETWPKQVTRSLAREVPFLKRGDLLTEEFIENLAEESQKEIARAINRRTEFKVLSTDFHEQIEE